MISFQYPELFLLAIPLWFVYRRWGRAEGVTGWLRLTLLALLLVCLTGPEVNMHGTGLDAVIVVDRSRSIRPAAQNNIAELLRNIEANRGPGDRVAVVTFGSEPRIEHSLSAGTMTESFQRPINPDGSDLNGALETALTQVDPRRPARVLVISDGEANGASPLSAARRARELGVPVDYRAVERPEVGDSAIESVQLPERVAAREPFQFAVWVYADGTRTGVVTVRREGEVIAAREQEFHSGMNRVLFRDLVDRGGFMRYDVDLDIAGDPLLENNRGIGIVRVETGDKLLVLSTDGTRDSNLVRALEAGRLNVDVAVAGEHPLTQDALDPYRAVIVENVPAADFGRLKMERLAQFVADLGGGLMLTGGQRSFGTGGYFNSPLDEVLPVSMEIREEHRKTRVAIAVALDRSGSMAVPVAGGKTKMDLANIGTAECIRILSPGDAIAVIAVDSSPHVIQSLTPVDDPARIANRVKKIESMGGGIFVYEALVAAGKELMKAEQTTKHIILFSDANDSEEPGSYKSLLAKFATVGITVSVIGLGRPTDVDAKLLQDIAKLGDGNIMFTEDPQELPRLFTDDTMSVARSSFVEKDPETQPDGISGSILPDVRLLGDLTPAGFPALDGYNLSYLKPKATAAAASNDEYTAPWSAFWYHGLGRVAALTFEVDGQFSGDFHDWPDAEDFLITHARWLVGGERPDDVYVDMVREGQDAVVTVELDPNRTRLISETPELVIVPPDDGKAAVIEPDFVWTGPHSLEARFRMDRTGTYRTLVRTGERQFVRGPAVALPYSPEFVPRFGLPSGRETLGQIAEITGGVPRTDVLQIFNDPPRSAQHTSLVPWLLILSVVLLVTEIAGRRLSLWEGISLPWGRRQLAGATTAASPPGASGSSRASWWPQWNLRRPARPKSSPIVTAPPAAKSRPAAKPSPTPRTQPSAGSKDIYKRAKNQAKKRLD